jgi:hypothetical protein
MEDERKPLDRLEVATFADIPEELKPEGKCFAQLQNGKRCNRETDTPFNIWCFRHQTCGCLGKYAEQAYQHETDIIDPFARTVKRLGEEYVEVPNACEVCGENYVGKPSCENNHMICVDCVKKLGKSQYPSCPICRAVLRIRPALFDVVMNNCVEAIMDEELKVYFIQYLLDNVPEVADIQNQRIQERCEDEGMLTTYWLNEGDVHEVRVGRDANGRPVREQGAIKTYGGDRFYREHFTEFKDSEFFKQNINVDDLRYRAERKAQAHLESL